MKFLFGLIGCLLLFSCNFNEKFKIEKHGAFDNVVKDINYSEEIDFSQFEGKKNFYALGALEKLKGEVIIYDSKPFFAFRSNPDLENQEIAVQNRSDVIASYAITAEVPKWKSFAIPNEVKSKKDLEKFILSTAKSIGIYDTEPFPFLVEGLISSISWHVVDWPSDETKKEGKKYYEIGYNETSIFENVNILGFYLDGHSEPFTNIQSNLKMHFVNIKGTKAGHVNDLIVGDNMVLKLPK